MLIRFMKMWFFCYALYCGMFWNLLKCLTHIGLQDSLTTGVCLVFFIFFHVIGNYILITKCLLKLFCATRVDIYDSHEDEVWTRRLNRRIWIMIGVKIHSVVYVENILEVGIEKNTFILFYLLLGNSNVSELSRI